MSNMTHDLIVRGFDDQTHSSLGKVANQKGVSINSIVKDAVDKWLKQQQEIPKRHYLVIYSSNESMTGLLKSMDRLATEANLFRCYFGPQNIPPTELLSKMRWYDGTIMPYYLESHVENQSQQEIQKQIPSQKNMVKYFSHVVKNIANNANNRQLCCVDFLINDIAKDSMKQALTIEHVYDNHRLPGIVYCSYKTDTLLNSEIENLIELFEMHDQIFLLKNDEVYKLHITKENVHKLFLN